MEQIFNRFMNAEFLILYSDQILKKKHHHEVVVTNGDVNNGQWTSEQALLHYQYYYWLEQPELNDFVSLSLWLR